MSEFEKWDKSGTFCHCSACREDRREGFVGALQCVQNLPRSTRYNYIELMVWIDAELKENEK